MLPSRQLKAPEPAPRACRAAPEPHWFGRARRAGLAVLLVAAVSACGGATDEDTYVERPVETLYNEAMDQLLTGELTPAVAAFDEVERQHPYSPWATRAQLMAAFTYYQANRYDDAIRYARHFVDLHPGHRDAAYARYLIALSYYEQITDVGRDQRNTARALAALERVVERNPNTVYARDAELKIDLARDHLAGKEMDVGRFYQRRGNYISAVNRFRTVIDKYQTTTHVPEALHRLTETYLALGLVEEAQAAAAVLGHNYPGERWYQESYALLADYDLEPEPGEGSWISRAWNSMF